MYSTVTNKAYGLNYDIAPVPYSIEKLQSIAESDQIAVDIQATQNILNNWKTKVVADTTHKPKLVILCVSGGGLKSATWTMQVVQQADSLLNGQLLNHTVLITGASGVCWGWVI
jgi:hypothetical protein